MGANGQAIVFLAEFEHFTAGLAPKFVQATTCCEI